MKTDTDMIDQLNEAFSRVAYHRDVDDFTQPRQQSPVRRRKTWLIVAASVSAAVATGGIAAARQGLPDATSYAEDRRSDAQAQALTDEAVTFDEYQAGFVRFAECMEDGGHPLSEIQLDQSTQLYSFTYDGKDDCYDREFYALDLVWQLDPDRPGFVASPSSKEVLATACRSDEATAADLRLSKEQLGEMCEWLEAQPSGE